MLELPPTSRHKMIDRHSATGGPEGSPGSSSPSDGVPTAERDSRAGTADRAKRLRDIHRNVILVFDLIHRELLKQRLKLCTRLPDDEMPVVVASAVFRGWMSAVMKMNSGHAIPDAGSATTCSGTADAMEPIVPPERCRNGIASELDDPAIIEKIMRSVFGRMLSPRWWSGKLAGGDPRESLDESIRLNRSRGVAFSRMLDSVVRHEAKAVSSCAGVELQF